MWVGLRPLKAPPVEIQPNQDFYDNFAYDQIEISNYSYSYGYNTVVRKMWCHKGRLEIWLCELENDHFWYKGFKAGYATYFYCTAFMGKKLAIQSFQF